jgi:hypothetical protein
MNARVEHLYLLDLNQISNKVLELRRLLLLNDSHNLFFFIIKNEYSLSTNFLFFRIANESLYYKSYFLLQK